jgi:hypothetical protein
MPQKVSRHAMLAWPSPVRRLCVVGNARPVSHPSKQAYKNLHWLNSSAAKPVRILAEYMEIEQRMTACGMKSTYRESAPS